MSRQHTVMHFIQCQTRMTWRP